MAADIRRSALSHAVGDVLQDVSELVQKEFRFARAELSAKVDSTVRGIAWIAVAGVFAIMTMLVLVEAAIFALADTGMRWHWACLIVAGALAILAIIAYFGGRGSSAGAASPPKTLQHVSMDIRTAKEHLT